MTTPAADVRPLRIVFLFRNLGYVRLFDPVLRGLLARGHTVHLLHERAGYSASEAAWLEEMERLPRFSWSLTDALYRDRWATAGELLRRFADYVYVLGPDFRDAKALVARTELRAPSWARRLLRLPPLRSARLRRALLRALLALEAAVPTSRGLADEFDAHAPDLFVLAPHLMPGFRHSEYVKAARSLGIPTCMCIASWDNLTTKQLIRELPDRVVVWNAIQAGEARRLHGVPEERIVVTGAQPFDEWLGREPRPRAAFLERVGLDPERPYVLYVSGALFPGPLTEAEWVRDRWIPALRADPRLSDLGVLVRPHPRRLEQWESVSFADLPGVAVWPPHDVPMPVDEESRADFFDSIHRSVAVVGINTTAMIEAAVVGRPVHTVLVPEFHESQRATHHFNYLLEVGGGVVETADSLEEHRERLAAVLAGDDGGAERRSAFLEAFVRPHGLDRPALPFVIDAIETAAALRTSSSPPLVEALRLPVRAVLRALIEATRLGRRIRRRAARPAG